MVEFRPVHVLQRAWGDITNKQPRLKEDDACRAEIRPLFKELHSSLFPGEVCCSSDILSELLGK